MFFIRTSTFTCDINGRHSRCFATKFALVTSNNYIFTVYSTDMFDVPSTDKSHLAINFCSVDKFYRKKIGVNPLLTL